MRFVISILLISFIAWADVQWPVLTSPVIDEVGWLNRQDKLEIENWIRTYRQNGRAQIQVVIVPDLQGLEIESYSIQLVERWQLGDKKKDDGVLFLISANERKTRIEVGQGLEGALTDLQTKRILDDRVRPLLRSKEYAAAIVAGVSEIIAAVDPEYTAQINPKVGPIQTMPDEKPSLFWIIIFLFFLISLFGRRRRRGGFLPFLGGFGTNYSVGRGGWSSGEGGWSGGGGGFSGGGASSDW